MFFLEREYTDNLFKVNIPYKWTAPGSPGLESPDEGSHGIFFETVEKTVSCLEREFPVPYRDIWSGFQDQWAYTESSEFGRMSLTLHISDPCKEPKGIEKAQKIRDLLRNVFNNNLERNSCKIITNEIQVIPTSNYTLFVAWSGYELYDRYRDNVSAWVEEFGFVSNSSFSSAYMKFKDPTYPREIHSSDSKWFEKLRRAVNDCDGCLQLCFLKPGENPDYRWIDMEYFMFHDVLEKPLVRVFQMENGDHFKKSQSSWREKICTFNDKENDEFVSHYLTDIDKVVNRALRGCLESDLCCISSPSSRDTVKIMNTHHQVNP